MARSRHSSSRNRLYRGLVLWGLVGVLVVWGGFQAMRVRQAVLARARKESSLPHRPKSPNGERISVTPEAHPTFLQRVYIGKSASSAADGPLASESAEEAAQDDTLEIISPTLLVKTADEYRGAQALLAAGRVIRAREMFNSALAGISGLGEREADKLRSALSSINDHTLLGTGVLPDDPVAHLIQVQPGDTLSRIADDYRLTTPLLRTLNPALRPQSLEAGTSVKVLLGPFDARIVIHANRLDIMLHRLYVGSVAFTLDDTLPVNPGSYDADPGDLGAAKGWPAGAMTLRPRQGDGRDVIIETSPASVGDIGVLPASLNRLKLLLSPEYSHVDVVP